MDKKEMAETLDARIKGLSNLSNDFNIAIDSKVSKIDQWTLINTIIKEAEKVIVTAKVIKIYKFEGWDEYEKRLSILKSEDS